MKRDSGLPSSSIQDLDKINLEFLVIYDDKFCEIFEVHFLGKKFDRNICFHYNPQLNKDTATGDYEVQTFAWIMNQVETGRFLILEGDEEEIFLQLHRKDVEGSLKNKWAPRPI